MLKRIAFATCTAVLPAALMLASITPPAEARGRGIGTVLGVGGALLLLNEAARGMQRNQGSNARNRNTNRNSSRRNRDRSSDSVSSGASDRQAQRLRENAAAQAARAEAIQRSESAELGRNVDKAVNRFISELERLHKRLRGARENVRAARSSDINQVTAGEVLRLVDDTYSSTDTRLAQFDQFAGELWTRDRLKVELLAEAKRGLAPYFDGVGAKGPSMQDLEVVFRNAGREVYARAVELSEIVGVSHSFDRFIRTISENSDRVPASLHTVGADARYEALLPRAMTSLDGSGFVRTSAVPAADRSGLNQRFQFRFRARRALYDCLSANYVEIATGEAPKEKSMEVGLIQINKIRTAPIGNRGAALAEVPSDNRPAAAVPSAGPATSAQEVMVRIHDQVEQKCGPYMTALYDTVRQGEFRPERARADIIQVLGGQGADSGARLRPIGTLPRQ